MLVILLKDLIGLRITFSHDLEGGMIYDPSSKSTSLDFPDDKISFKHEMAKKIF